MCGRRIRYRSDEQNCLSTEVETWVMPEQSLNSEAGLVSTELKLRVAFLALGIISWLGAKRVTGNQRLQLFALHGVGNVAPTLITEWRD